MHKGQHASHGRTRDFISWTHHPEWSKQEVQQLNGTWVLDVVLQLPLQTHTADLNTHTHTPVMSHDHVMARSYQLVEGMFELLQTVDEVLISWRSGAQSEDAL